MVSDSVLHIPQYSHGGTSEVWPSGEIIIRPPGASGDISKIFQAKRLLKLEPIVHCPRVVPVLSNTSMQRQ